MPLLPVPALRAALTRWLVATVLAIIVGHGSTQNVYGAAAANRPCCKKPGCRTCCAEGQYWRISTLKAPPCRCLNPNKLEYFVYQCGRGWVRSSREAFLAADDPQISTAFFVHGYFPQKRITRSKMVADSTDGGWLAYRKLSPRNRPFRLVLWSWAGERAEDRSKMVPNMRKKLAWAEIQGWYLAWVIDQMNPQTPVGLVADSLGASAATGALHVLGGGAVGRNALVNRVHPERMPLTAALVAGTMNNRWLSQGSRHGLALSQVDRMIITVNPKDRMFKLYRIFKIGGGGLAVGATGVVGPLGPYRDRVVHFNVTSYLRGQHWWKKYLGEPAITRRLSPFVFPPPAASISLDEPSGPQDNAPLPPITQNLQTDSPDSLADADSMDDSVMPDDAELDAEIASGDNLPALDDDASLEGNFAEADVELETLLQSSGPQLESAE